MIAFPVGASPCGCPVQGLFLSTTDYTDYSDFSLGINSFRITRIIMHRLARIPSGWPNLCNPRNPWFEALRVPKMIHVPRRGIPCGCPVGVGAGSARPIIPVVGAGLVPAQDGACRRTLLAPVRSLPRDAEQPCTARCRTCRIIRADTSVCPYAKYRAPTRGCPYIRNSSLERYAHYARAPREGGSQ